jgi:hypothetical protein
MARVRTLIEIAATAALVVLLTGCEPQGLVADEDLGPVENVLDEIDRTVWPGVDTEWGFRHIRRINGYFAGEPTGYFFVGFSSRVAANIFWMCPEGQDDCPFDRHGVVQHDSASGLPVFDKRPGEVGYTPFWLTWKVTVPDDYEPNMFKSQATIEEAVARGDVEMELLIFEHTADIGPAPAIQHCLLVLDGTQLEFNGEALVSEPDVLSHEVLIKKAWHKGYQVNYYDFTDTEGVFPPAEDSESIPKVPTSDIFVFFRDCAGGSTAPICDMISADYASVSDRGVEADLNNDDDRGDTNNVIAGFPQIPGDHPSDRLYSPLWLVQQTVPVPSREHEIYLYDDSGDQDDSGMMDTDQIYWAVDQGILYDPIPISEADIGNSEMGNDGDVFFDCPSQVALGEVLGAK